MGRKDSKGQSGRLHSIIDPEDWVKKVPLDEWAQEILWSELDLYCSPSDELRKRIEEYLKLTGGRF